MVLRIILLCHLISLSPPSSPFFFLLTRRPPRSTLFPTRRSSDLHVGLQRGPAHASAVLAAAGLYDGVLAPPPAGEPDRKSTRLNSSHVAISYAVFCLKKKKTRQNQLYHKNHSSTSHSYLFLRTV